MTLEAQLDIFHQLIKENPDITIAEFIEIISEIDAITPKIEKEWKTKKYATNVGFQNPRLIFPKRKLMQMGEVRLVPSATTNIHVR